MRVMYVIGITVVPRSEAGHMSDGSGVQGIIEVGCTGSAKH
jgi:hypothetical protein